MTRRILLRLFVAAASFGIIGILAANVTPLRAIQTPGDSARRGTTTGDSTLWVEMRTVDLHIDDDHAMRVSVLRGQVTSTKAGQIPLLDDPTSFRIRVTSGTVGLTGADLAALLNGYVFAYPGAPLRNIKARTDGSQVVLSGIMHKGVDLPFEITSTLSVDPDGRIRSHPTRTRILGVNGAALLHALGLHLDNVLNLRGARGASVKGDDLFLEPTRIIPPPEIEGRLASIRVEGEQIVQTFVSTADDAAAAARFHPDSAAHHFIYFRGGQLRFGKLTMTDTDLLIVDADQSNPFDLYILKYNQQLVAGHTITLLDYGLRVTMPDYAVVKSRKEVAASTSERP